MTVPVFDNKDQHVGWSMCNPSFGYCPIWNAPTGLAPSYQYGAFGTEMRQARYSIDPKTKEKAYYPLPKMHGWDLDPNMVFSYENYRLMVEGDL